MRAPRILILGTEKIGKTSFACGCHFEAGHLVQEGINNPVILSMKDEEGADDLNVPSFPTLTSSDQVLEAIGALYGGNHNHKTVVIDSASALEPVIWDDLCRRHNVAGIEKVGGGYGKGYIEAMGVVRQILGGLDALRTERNMSSVIIGHVKVKRFDDPNGDSYDSYMFDVHDRIANLLYRWADSILFCNMKVTIKKEDQGFGKEKKRGIDLTGGARFLYTQKRPAHPGGGRGIYGRLPYELPLDYVAFENAVANAMEREE